MDSNHHQVMRTSRRIGSACGCLRTDVSALTEQVAGVPERLASLETRVGHIESRLVARHSEAP